MDGAKAILDANVAKGKWGNRDVGWFRLNIENDPELDLDGEGIPEQMIVNPKNDISRFVHFHRSADSSQKEEEAKFAEIVRELTGEWFTHMPCDKI